MVKKNYQTELQIDEKKIVKAMLKNKPISTKYAIELCRELKNKPINKAERFLRDIVEMKRFLPLRKYNKKVPHRRGNAISKTKSGKYPVKTAKVFLELLQNLKANADYKGLDSEKLILKHLFASYGFRRITFQPQGRISGKRRKKKSTHLEAMAVEGA
ncbi:MAG: 50S ribosomal protein L22 [Candidatus Diapherotrites archaeon]|nr:50S ribosomal protein L22 [Candidatus Diapherotrites archaeon]